MKAVLRVTLSEDTDLKDLEKIISCLNHSFISEVKPELQGGLIEK